jgi:hypothetical protein
MQPLPPPVLAIPYEEAKSLLTRQLLQGERLRNEARRFLDNPGQDSVAGWWAKVIIWSDANERLLQRLFTSGGAPEEFTRKRGARKRLTSSPTAGNLSETLGLIETEQNELNELLALLPSNTPPEAPSVASEAEKRQAKEPGAQRTTWHAVRSTSLQDLPTTEDLLGFKPYVNAMAAFLANPKTQPPLTLSIEGKGGSGKSSFMLQLENALRSELKGGARFVRFNAWRHDKGEALWAAFALELSRQLVKDRAWLVRQWKRLRLGLARLQRGQGWLGFLKLEQFHEDFRLLLECYASPTEKIFVFIDDLDRCELPKALELLQALNLMIPESSRVIVILGMDREKVAAGIAMRHEKVLPLLAPPSSDSASKLPFDPVLAAAFGRDFLERFLQLPFRLPRPVPERLDGMLDILLGVHGQPPDSQRTLELGKTAPQLWPTSAPEPLSEETKARRAEMLRKADMDSPEVREVMKRLAPALELNPRRLKQFLNVFRLSVYIANSTGLFDSGSTLTLSQLGKLVAMGQRWPELLDDLEAEPELLAELEDPKRPATCQATSRWRRDALLQRLLQAGLDEGKGGEEHSLKGLDLQRLRSMAITIPREMGGEPSPRQSSRVS